MMDFLDTLANNDYVLSALVIVLIVLVLIFFIVLFFTGKKDRVKEDIIKKDFENDNNNLKPANIDFDHDEYVKETTGEFELTEVSNVLPINDDFIPASTEESPAYKIEEPTLPQEVEVNSFSFDELSKMISKELDTIKENAESTIKEEKVAMDVKPTTEPNIPKVTFVDSFKEVSSNASAVETPKIEKTSYDNAANNRVNISDIFSSVYVKSDAAPISNIEESSVELPKLNVEEKQSFNSEPVIKDEQTPLYARFNQESYDIDKKD